MKKTSKTAKIISLVLCAVFIALALCSCGKSGAVLTYTVDGKDYTLTEKEYSFLMKYTKFEYFYNNGFPSTLDPSIMSIEVEEGKTLDSYLTESVVKTAKTIVAEKYLMEKYGLTLSEEDVKKAKDDVKTAEKNYGGAGAYKKYWGFTANELYEYQLSVLRSKAVFNYLFDEENGAMKLTDEQLEEYYKENFKQYQIIMISTEKKIATDDDGNKKYVVYDENSNSLYVTDISEEYLEENKYTLGYNYQYLDLTDEEKSKKATLADEIIEQLKSGADFKELALANSDYFFTSYYPEGIITSGNIVDDENVIKALEELEIGSYTDAISVNSGKYVYIIKRVELKEKAYEDAYEDAEDKEYAELFEGYVDTVKYSKYSDTLAEYTASIVSNDEILGKYKMSETYLSKFVKDNIG
ncbi:MAG: peptidylprolyl isomerase [Eubacteriales bacterium]